MKFILVVLYFFSISRIIDLSPILGVSTTSYWYTYFTFSLVHANLFHIVTNSFAFVCNWRIIKKLNMYLVIPMMLFIPAVSALLSVKNIPTVGLSAVVYTMIGIITTLYQNKKAKYKLETIIIFSFIVTYVFAPHINTLIHIYSYFIALAISYVIKPWIR